MTVFRIPESPVARPGELTCQLIPGRGLAKSTKLHQAKICGGRAVCRIDGMPVCDYHRQWFLSPPTTVPEERPPSPERKARITPL